MTTPSSDETSNAVSESGSHGDSVWTRKVVEQPAVSLAPA